MSFDDLPLFAQTPPAPASPPRSVEGELRKERGISAVDAKEGDEWKARADSAIAELAASAVEFSAEDVRKRAGDPTRPNAMGARFYAAAKAGLIKYVRHQKSTRPSLHACKVAVWVGATR